MAQEQTPPPNPMFFNLEDLQQQPVQDIESEIRIWAGFSLMAKVSAGLGAIAAPMELAMEQSPGKALVGVGVAVAGYFSGKFIDQDNGIRWEELARRRGQSVNRRSGRHKRS